MITEDFCSYELSKLLKEKGFDEPVETVIYPNGEWAFIDTRSVSRTLHTMLRNSELNIYDDCVSMPTHQLACKWLREVRGLFVDISFVKDEDRVFWFYAIFELYNDNEAHYNNVDEFPTYEGAVEAALKYSLKNLI